MNATAASLIADIPRLSPDEARFMRRIFDRVLIVGRASYSPWVAANDTRDMDKEMSDESLDRAIYGAMGDVMREDAKRERAACAGADRVWSAMVGEDGFCIVTEAVSLPDVVASFDCDEGNVAEVLR